MSLTKRCIPNARRLGRSAPGGRVLGPAFSAAIGTSTRGNGSRSVRTVRIDSLNVLLLVNRGMSGTNYPLIKSDFDTKSLEDLYLDLSFRALQLELGGLLQTTTVRISSCVVCHHDNIRGGIPGVKQIGGHLPSSGKAKHFFSPCESKFTPSAGPLAPDVVFRWHRLLISFCNKQANFKIPH